MTHALDHLIQPTFVLLVLLAWAIARLWRQRREERRRLLLVTVPLVLLIVLSLPVFAYVALGTLESSYPPSRDVPANVEAIVVLSGYMYAPDDADPAKSELGADTYYRCQHALALYRKVHGCPILVSGGISEGAPKGPALADTMRGFFRDKGIKDVDIMVENRSATTHENAELSAELLRARGIQRIILVTDAKHMWRAALCFEKQGLHVTPSACNSYTDRFRNRWFEYLPSPDGARATYEAFHEWVGVAYYKLRGWI